MRHRQQPEQDVVVRNQTVVRLSTKEVEHALRSHLAHTLAPAFAPEPMYVAGISVTVDADEMGTLLGAVLTYESKPAVAGPLPELSREQSLENALRDLLALAERWEVKLDGQFGGGQDLANIERSGKISVEILAARKVLGQSSR